MYKLKQEIKNIRSEAKKVKYKVAIKSFYPTKSELELEDK